MKKTIIAIAALTGLLSCNRNVVYDNTIEVGNPIWDADSAASFTVAVSDTSMTYQLGIRVRNSEKFASQNLWLFVTEIRPDSSLWRDTVEFFLADDYGRWTGEGLSSLHTNLFLYKDSVHYPAPGNYIYNIRHGMRDEALTGITDLGIKVVKME